MIFDENSKGVIASDKALIYYSTIKDDEIVFKATYYIVGDIVCSGKISALFDLIIVGNVYADEIDIKGKFVCTGDCQVKKTLTVQNDIWTNNLEADSIICHENCLAQELDAGDVKVDGNITIGKAFGIERMAQCNQRIICGETIYGSGKVITDMVITGDPIDLDEGEESLLPPNKYIKNNVHNSFEVKPTGKEYIKKCTGSSDYKSFLNRIILKGEPDEQEKAKLYLGILEEASTIVSSRMREQHDARILLGLLDLDCCGWFEECQTVHDLKTKILDHFESFAKGVFPYSEIMKHPKDLNCGDCVIHIKYGKGKVIGKEEASTGKTITVAFNSVGEKRFIIPKSLDGFTVVQSDKSASNISENTAILCKVSDYSDWLECLTILYKNATKLSLKLYNAIYDELMSNLGLKAKYITDRFNEKGWNHYGK